jgi:hypothetical protein
VINQQRDQNQRSGNRFARSQQKRFSEHWDQQIDSNKGKRDWDQQMATEIAEPGTSTKNNQNDRWRHQQVGANSNGNVLIGIVKSGQRQQMLRFPQRQRIHGHS